MRKPLMGIFAGIKMAFFRSVNEKPTDSHTQLLENAQELPKVRIGQCLVPRKEIVGISQEASIEELKQQFIDTKLSRLVVYNKTIDRIVGYVHQLDLFAAPATIGEILYPIPAVPESMSATNLIATLSREKKSMAWVIDEFGGTAGIITMEDVLEEIFGEIQDEYDTEELLEQKISNDEFIFSGRMELDHLEQKYGIALRQEEAETLSGYIINYHEKIPRQQEQIVIDGYAFEILQVSDTRIETVRVKRLH
ncbi:MAG: hemolysin family protein [Sphingomonadales bacterium]|nr:HlyC/CorC family transporter [Sphingomonadales bacterium]